MFRFLQRTIDFINNWLWPKEVEEEELKPEIRPLNKTHLPGKRVGKRISTPRFVRYEKLRRR